MLEKWRKAFDKERNMSTIFMNLSKAFDTINHDLLIAKLHAMDFQESLKMIKSYLIKCYFKQKQESL